MASSRIGGGGGDAGEGSVRWAEAVLKVDGSERRKEEVLALVKGLGGAARARRLRALLEEVYGVKMDRGRFTELTSEMVRSNQLQLTSYGVYKLVKKRT